MSFRKVPRFGGSRNTWVIAVREMDLHKWRNDLVSIYLAAERFAALPLDQMYERVRRAETLGPIMDPTLFRENGGRLHSDIALIEAAREFRDKVRQAVSAAMARSLLDSRVEP